MRYSYLIILIFILQFSCNKEHIYSGDEVELQFSTDTVSFDTVFTAQRSITKRLMVYNNYDESVKIKLIRVSSGENSPFTLNVNGTSGKYFENIIIKPKDSLYVFIQVKHPENGQDLPLLINDAIMFEFNNNIQDIKLITYSQDVSIFRDSTIKTQIWMGSKPYLIYGTLTVDTLESLTIEPGVVVYMHRGANIIVKGSIDCQGTFDKQIVFKGDRLDKDYSDIPGQWGGIFIQPGNRTHYFNWTVIENGTTGLEVGGVSNLNVQPSLELNNVVIQNMAYACLVAYNTKIHAGNCLIANAKTYTCQLIAGGEYKFNQSTIANYYSIYDYRDFNQPTLSISNAVMLNNSQVLFDLSGSFFRNSIIYGTSSSELTLDNKAGNVFDISFDHCLLKGKSSNFVADYFANCTWNEDPKFKNTDKLVFELDTLSPAKDAGAIEWGGYFPYDLLNKSRLTDKAPDLGAYERKE